MIRPAILASMPTRKILKGSLEGSAVYDPDQVRELARVYREVASALRMTSRSDRQKAARTVMRVAGEQQGFDAATIKDQALAVLRRETAKRRSKNRGNTQRN
jgi:hypothetical protein